MILQFFFKLLFARPSSLPYSYFCFPSQLFDLSSLLWLRCNRVIFVRYPIWVIGSAVAVAAVVVFIAFLSFKSVERVRAVGVCARRELVFAFRMQLFYFIFLFLCNGLQSRDYSIFKSFWFRDCLRNYFTIFALWKKKRKPNHNLTDSLSRLFMPITV